MSQTGSFLISTGIDHKTQIPEANELKNNYKIF